MFGNFTRQAAVATGIMLAAMPALAEDASERAILVLDASGSMWGQVEGAPKIAIARDVIQGLLGDWNPNVELGVTAYGHREKGNCSDIETLVPLGPVDGDQVMSAIGSLNPKGKTPLTDAVRQAAETLKYTEERATVLLVSDGKETCDADPCAAAAELEANGIDFTVHVVGFDLTDEEKEQLQCVADNTGGKFLSADNAPELHAAMETTVQLVTEPEPKPMGPTGMRLTAALVEGGEPVKALFDIRKAEPDLDGKRELVEREHSKANKPAKVELPAGSYFVTAIYGKAKRSVEIAVAEGEMAEQTIVVPAGHLRLRAALTEGGDDVKARIEVRHNKKNPEGKRKMVGSEHSKPGKPALFQLAEGTYFVTAFYGKAERSFEIDVQAGELTEETLVVAAGRLRIAAALVEGGEPVEALIKVMGSEVNADGKRHHFSTNPSKPNKLATFELAAGRYHVEARYGDARAARDIEVGAGKVTEETIIVGAGRLKLPTRMISGAEPLTEDGHHTIYAPKKDQLGEVVYDKVTTGGLDQIFSLPAGSYRVETKYRANYGNAVIHTDVDVEPGQLVEQDAVLDSGILRLKSLLANDGDPLEDDLHYKIYEPIKDQLGEITYDKVTSGLQDTVFSLKSGTYRVETTFRANYGNVIEQVDVDVRAGEIIEQTIVLDSGHLKPTALLVADGEPLTEGITYKVYEPKKDQLGEVVYDKVKSGGPEVIFSLRAGGYRIEAVHQSSHGKAVGSIDVDVRPGERVDAAIILSDEG